MQIFQPTRHCKTACLALVHCTVSRWEEETEGGELPGREVKVGEGDDIGKREEGEEGKGQETKTEV